VHRPVLARPLSLICRYPFIWEFRFLVALSPRAGLVTLRQTFVRRRHGGGNRPCWGLEDEHSELTVNGAQLEYVGGSPATGSNYLMIDKERGGGTQGRFTWRTSTRAKVPQPL